MTDVFVAARGRDGRDAQLHDPHRALEADLAVLGLALLGDVQLGHDLEALHDRVAVRGRDLDVLLAVSVHAQAHDGGGLLAVGLDVDVGRALVVGVDDDLVAELHDAAVRLVDLRFRGLLLALDLVLFTRSELGDDPAEVLLLHRGPRSPRRYSSR
jgi:hypothetical protein